MRVGVMPWGDVGLGVRVWCLMRGVNCELSSLVQRSTVNGADGHNRGGVVERPLLARTQGRTVGRTLTQRGVGDCDACAMFWV